MTQPCPDIPFFGASYPDGTCIDGYMWDLDSCDIPKGPLFSGGDVPCPFCNADAYIEHQKDDYVETALCAAYPNTDTEDFTDAMWNIEGPQLAEKMVRGYLEKLHAEYGWTPAPVNGPQIVCAGCNKPTTLFKPICDECLP